MFDGHDALIGKQLLGVIVNQLTVDENVDIVFADLLNLKENNANVKITFDCAFTRH